MRLWHVSRDAFTYDEYDAWTVRASSAEDAVRVVWEVHGRKEYPNGYVSDAWSLGDPADYAAFRAAVAVAPVPAKGERGIILESFNAG